MAKLRKTKSTHLNVITEESEGISSTNHEPNSRPQAAVTTGYDAPAKMPDWTPSHDGTNEGFPQWEAKLEAWMSELLGAIINLTTGTLTEYQDRLLYNIIIKGINRKLFDHISSQAKNKGLESLNILRKLHLGTAEKRKVTCILNLGNLKYPANKCATTFSTQLHKIKSDCETYEIFNKGAELIVVLAMAALPSEFESLIQHLKGEPQMPTLARFTERLIDDELRMKTEAKHKVESIAVVSSNNKRKRPQQKKKRRTVSDVAVSYAEAPVVAAVGGPGPAPAYQQRRSPRGSRPQAGSFQRGGGGRPNQLKCNKCLGRNHQTQQCRSTKWCHSCRNASHDTNYCKNPRQ